MKKSYFHFPTLRIRQIRILSPDSNSIDIDITVRQPAHGVILRGTIVTSCSFLYYTAFLVCSTLLTVMCAVAELPKSEAIVAPTI